MSFKYVPLNKSNQEHKIVNNGNFSLSSCVPAPQEGTHSTHVPVQHADTFTHKSASRKVEHHYVSRTPGDTEQVREHIIIKPSNKDQQTTANYSSPEKTRGLIYLPDTAIVNNEQFEVVDHIKCDLNCSPVINQSHRSESGYKNICQNDSNTIHGRVIDSKTRNFTSLSIASKDSCEHVLTEADPAEDANQSYASIHHTPLQGILWQPKILQVSSEKQKKVSVSTEVSAHRATAIMNLQGAALREENSTNLQLDQPATGHVNCSTTKAISKCDQHVDLRMIMKVDSTRGTKSDEQRCSSDNKEVYSPSNIAQPFITANNRASPRNVRHSNILLSASSVLGRNGNGICPSDVKHTKECYLDSRGSSSRLVKEGLDDSMVVPADHLKFHVQKHSEEVQEAVSEYMNN